jgi:hypothetical protein
MFEHVALYLFRRIFWIWTAVFDDTLAFCLEFVEKKFCNKQKS